MPDAFGNPTPQEVLAQIAQERDMMIDSAQTPDQRRNAQLFALGRALTTGLDPRLINAKAIDDALRKSSSLSRSESESALDFEIRRGRQMFEDIKMVDPTTAADISAKLIELEAERNEQLRLKAEDVRTQESHELDVRQQAGEIAARDITEGLFYEYDPRASKLTGVTTAVRDATHGLVTNEVRERENILLSVDDVVAAQLNDSEANLKLLGSDFAAQRGVISSARDSTIVARDLAKLYVETATSGMNPATAADMVMRKGQSVMLAINEARKAAGLAPAPEIGSPEFAEDQSAIERMLADRGVQSQVPTAMLTLFTYAVAKSYDPRVTEQDFRNFSSLLGGTSGSPPQIMATMHQLLMGRHENITRDLNSLANNLLEQPKGSTGHEQGRILRQQLDDLAAAKGEFEAPFRVLMEKYDARVPGESAPTPPDRLRTGGQDFIFTDGGN